MLDHKTEIKLAITLLLVFGIVTAAYQFFPTTPPPTNTPSTSTSTRPVTTSNPYFYFPQDNFEFIPHPDWNQISPESLRDSLDPKLGEPLFVFQKQNSACTMAFLIHEGWPEYKQTSFAPRFFSQEHQFDSSWYLSVDKLPANFKFQWEGKQPFPGEVQIIPAPSHFYRPSNPNGPEILRYFVLFDAQGQIVDDECTQENISMLQTLKTRYDSTSLNPTSNGALYVFNSRQQSTATNRVLFKPTGDDIEYEVASFQGPELSNFTVHGNLMYWIDNGKLESFDPFTKIVKPITELDLPSDYILADYLFKDDDLFLITGSNCQIIQDNCDVSLYQHHIGTNGSALIGNANAWQITGYDPNRNTIALTKSWGDAGCWSAQYTTFNLATKEKQITKQWGGCDGGATNSINRQEQQAFTLPFQTSIEQNGHIQVTGGKLINSPTGFTPKRTFSAIRFE